MLGTAFDSVETPLDPEIALSLCFLPGSYHRRGDGSYEFAGPRPGPGGEGGTWHIHGWLTVHPRVLLRGVPVGITLHKRRWRHSVEGHTVHSRPPDDIPFAHSCTLVVSTLLYGALAAAKGLHMHRRLWPALDVAVSTRHLQRWIQRARDLAEHTQQAVRAALIEKCEPRPLEHVFPGGLSPPDGLSRYRQNPSKAAILWRGLLLLFEGAKRLKLSPSCLAAEARGRWTGPQSRFVI